MKVCIISFKTHLRLSHDLLILLFFKKKKLRKLKKKKKKNLKKERREEVALATLFNKPPHFGRGWFGKCQVLLASLNGLGSSVMRGVG
jgi:hypothetical protein